MKQKDIKQITDEVVKEGFLSNKPNNPVTDYQNRLRAQGATSVVAAGGVALLLKKLYDSYKKENKPERKAKLKVKILKTKAKLEKLKSKSKKLSEALENFTEEELINEWNKHQKFVQELSDPTNFKSTAKYMKRRTGSAVRRLTGTDTLKDKFLAPIDWKANRADKKNIKKYKKEIGTAAAVSGVAGVLAYKLYKKLKEKYNKAKDPKEKAKLKKLVVKAKAKSQKKQG